MGVDLSLMAQLKEDMNRAGVKYLKLGPGQHTVRLLPPPEGMSTPWIKYKIAKVGPNEIRVIPPSQFDSSAEDPTVTERERLLSMGDEASRQRADSLRWRDEYALFVVKRGPDEAQGPVLWTTSRKTINTFLAFFADPDTGDFTDPVNGYDIMIEGVQVPGKRGTEYTFMTKRKPSPLGGNPEWLKENYFTKFKVGRASDAPFIVAAMEGREKEFKEQRKAEFAAKRAAGQDTSFNPAELGTPAQPQAVDTSAVQAKLAEIKNRGKKAPAAKTSEVSKELQDID